MLQKESFGAYTLFTLSNGALRLSVTDLGATAVSLRFGGRDCILGYESPAEYLAGSAYLGATVGRVANRIGGASFPLDGVRYALTPNEGPNQLHGGPDSFDKRRWDAEEPGGDALRFTLDSPDGDNGFPGRLRAAVTYRLLGDTLRIEFEGDCDRDTVFAPANHMYFDLSGGRRVLEDELWINAARYVEPGPGLIPTGRLLPAEGAFDFRSPRRIGRNYDHAFVLEGEHACTLRSGGLQMELYTDFPALQVYAGEFLAPPFGPNQGLALEPEFFPDSPNHPDFPSVTLRAGERFSHWAEYRFAAL
jgi:aldose 1-epimerase